MLLKIFSYSHSHLSSSLKEEMLKLYKAAQGESHYKRPEAKDLLFESFQASYLLAFYEKQVVGYIIYKRQRDQMVELWDFHISPAFWGKSASDQLLKYFYDQVLAHGERGELEVSLDNQPALGLYQRNHWKITRRRDNYYRDASDALILQIKKDE